MLKSKNKGFSILELIMAVGILSVGLVAILQALAFCARVTGFSSDIIEASFLAQDKFDEMEYKEINGRTDEEPPNASGTTGAFGWSSTLIKDEALSLYKFNFQVNWQGAGRQESISLDTYLR
ncbi:MAG: prepilin-type N-terminal cleavage/methylation domain-containing protein [Candidatus Omnitrophota bacterium]